MPITTQQQGEEMKLEDMPLYIALETTSAAGKESWAIWERDTDSSNYSYLVARVYDAHSTERIVNLLNINANKEKK
jgi:hypothetical protein